jgi:hypothetical protein
MYKVAYIILIGFLLSACSPKSLPVTQSTSQVQNAYPTANQEVASGYPNPEVQPTAILLPTWTPDSSKGIVKGRIMIRGKPMENPDLYLADILFDKNGKEVSARLDRATSPRAISDRNGNFIFLNVPPGRYGLILDEVVQSYILSKPNTDEQIRAQVTAGSTVDLGTLDFPDLPNF